VLHRGLQKAMITDLFSNLSADGDSGAETFPAPGAYSRTIRCCYEGGVDSMMRGVFVGS